MMITLKPLGRYPSINHVPARNVSFNFFKKGDSKKDSSKEKEEGKSVKVPLSSGPVSSPMWAHLSEQEIFAKRNKSRLPHDVTCELKGIPHLGSDLGTRKEHYDRQFIRSYYAMYGKASGVNPLVCYPSKQELEFKVAFEQKVYPSFQQMVDEKRIQKKDATANMNQRRHKILENLKKLPAAKEAFYQRLREKDEKEAEEAAKREKLIQDVREYLGYDVAPGDTRFQEALAKKEEEEKLLKKASKKAEKQAKIMATLASMAEEQVKKAKEETAGEAAPASSAEPEKKAESPGEGQEVASTKSKKKASTKKVPSSDKESGTEDTDKSSSKDPK